MFSIIKPRTLLVIPLFAISGCVQTLDSNVAQIPTAKAGAPSAPNNKKPIIVTSLLDVHSSKIVKEAKELVENQKFDQIEAKAAEYRHSQAMFVDGSWKLEYLYRGLVRLSNPDSNAEWEQRCKLIRNWVVSHPKSVTARVALARIYYKGASQARSGDVADKVSGAQWMTMKERLDEATKVLSGSTSMRNQCPGWYFVAQNVAFLLERPQAEYDAITDEAIRQFPHYYEFYFGKITYLMPRWFGNKGDWQKYATEVANTLGPDDGDVFYARALWQMELMVDTEDSLELTDFDWERAKRGFSLLLKDPDSFAVAGAFAQAAWLAKDRKQLKVLFDNNLQNHYDSKVWISEEVFQKAYSWAYANK